MVLSGFFFWISLNSVPVLQFLSTEREVSSQDGCKCNAEWGMKRAGNESNLPYLALPIKGTCPIPGDHLSHNLVFRIFFLCPYKTTSSLLFHICFS